MGKCIVCDRSAGPFYSLHKTCYQAYQDVRGDLQRIFSESIESAVKAEELAEALYGCRPASPFSLRQFENLIIRTWQEQAGQIVRSKSLDHRHANYLLAVAPVLAIEDKDVEPHLFQRLANIQHLERINQGKPALKIFTALDDGIDLAPDEAVIWVFEDVMKAEQQQSRAENQQWSIFQSILNGLFNKSRYKDKELRIKVEAAGNLAITNQSLYYVTKGKVTEICLADIYSITPMKDGVRIQTTQRDTTPDTYITDIGRA